MTYNDFFISGEPVAARALVEGIVSAQGYTMSELPNGAIKLERGSKSKTMWLGVWAGQGFYCWFTCEYFTAPDGQLIARLTSNTGQGLLGGVYGIAKASRMYDELVAAMHAGLVAQQRLTNVVTG